jgi:cation diffusion facilitator CzcD-associated flavoprotein CzcO
MASTSDEHVDVLILGAGVGAGCRLQQKCPGKTFAILVARGAIGRGRWRAGPVGRITLLKLRPGERQLGRHV